MVPPMNYDLMLYRDACVCYRPQSFVGDDGYLHIVAERGSIRAALGRLDLSRARLLTRLSLFWIRRVR